MFRLSSALLFSLFVLSSAGCSKDDAPPAPADADAGDDADTDATVDAGCLECDPCGSSTPVLQDAISVVKAGKDAMGRAAVLLDEVKAGECRSDVLKRPETLHILSATTFDTADGEETIDTSDVDASGQTYTWKDRTLTLVAASEPPNLSLVFSGDTNLSVLCTPNGDFVVCKKQ